MSGTSEQAQSGSGGPDTRGAAGAAGGPDARGALIAFEGLDGSGKATQSELLYQSFCEFGLPVRKISFPDYTSPSSSLVKMYLAGEFGSDPHDVNAWAASSFYAVDRYAGYKKDWGAFYREGGILIADRYTTSNAIHQCSKLPKEQWDSFLAWLFHFEYELLGIPEPDLVIYLRTDEHVSEELMDDRYHGDADKKDIHEKNPGYLHASHLAGDYCAEKLGWKTVNCMHAGSIRSVQDIAAEVLGIVERYVVR